MHHQDTSYHFEALPAGSDGCSAVCPSHAWHAMRKRINTESSLQIRHLWERCKTLWITLAHLLTAFEVSDLS